MVLGFQGFGESFCALGFRVFGLRDSSLGF